MAQPEALKQGPAPVTAVLVSLTVAASVLVFSRNGLAAFAAPKAVVVVVGALASAASIALVRGRHPIPRPPGSVLLTSAAFVAALSLATAVSPSTIRSVLGQYGRFSGLAVYMACVILFLGAALSLNSAATRRLLVPALIASTAAVSLYSILQSLGIDPIAPERTTGFRTIGTLGNPNFLSAFLAVGALISAGDALQRRGRRRVFDICTALLAVAAVAVAGSVQGPVAIVVGGAVLAAATLLERGVAPRRVATWIGVAAVVAVTALGAAALGIEPMSSVLGGRTLELRQIYWGTAVDMWRDNPVAGVGLDMYGDYYAEYRPAGVVERLGPEAMADEPHSVPLSMFTSGGVVLGFAYLSVVIAVARELMLALRKRGPHRLLVATVGSGWLAYQTTALVSIDVPSLMTINWVLAGAIVAGAAEVRATETRDAGGRGAPQRRPTRSPAGLSAATVLALLLVPTAWFGMQLVRADAAAATARAASQADRPDVALEAASAARAVAGWEPTFIAEEAFALADSGQLELAAAVFESAFERNPRSLEYAVNAARTSFRAGDLDDADRWYEIVTRLSPTAPEFVAEQGELALAQGDVDRSAELLEAAVRQDPNASWYAILARAELARGRPDAADTALERALALDPENALALEVQASFSDVSDDG